MNMLVAEYNHRTLDDIERFAKLFEEKTDKESKQVEFALGGWILKDDVGGYVSMKTKIGEESICLFATEEDAINAKGSIDGNLEAKFYGLVELKDKTQ